MLLLVMFAPDPFYDRPRMGESQAGRILPDMVKVADAGTSKRLEKGWESDLDMVI